uniref:Uncharacterized protein n=1 Tax=Romanomermis culicivorax TaxID=13658 RepID=A0A915KLZ5_ROMCU
PPVSLLHLWSYLEDYLPVALSLAVGYLTVAVKHCFADNNKPHLRRGKGVCMQLDHRLTACHNMQTLQPNPKSTQFSTDGN